MSEHFSIGDSLRVKKYVERADGRSSIKPGDIVKVIGEFKFPYQGETSQDITVQKDNNLPIAVLVSSGAFERIKT